MTQPTYGPLPGPSYDLSTTDDNRRLTLAELDEYYRGEQRQHHLTLAQQRRRSSVINVPRLVVDSIEDRLDVDGFRMAGSQAADVDLWRIWQANNLDEESQLCHLDSLIFGRSFALVWVGEDVETPRITVESAQQMSVVLDPSSRRVVRAVKRWAEDGEQRATIYTPTEVVRLRASLGASAMDLSKWESRGDSIPNPLGVVPVVPFVNRPMTARPLGESEMLDVIPIADDINELVDSMMVTARYYATPRRWATGVDLGTEANADRAREKIRQVWSQAEQDRVWTSDSSSTTFGQFEEARLENFVTAINMLTARAAAISGLPPHYFGQAGENPASADALRSSESSLVKRALRKQRVLGGSWEAVMGLAVLIRDGASGQPTPAMETIWASPETPTVAQKADAAVKLVQAQVITPEQALEDLGYTPEQRSRMTEERDRAALGAVRVQLDEAARLQREDGLSQQAAFAAVGLLQAAQAIGQQPAA